MRTDVAQPAKVPNDVSFSPQSVEWVPRRVCRLSRLQEFIVDHGGDLVVEPRDGGGTVFSVRLPLGLRGEDR